VEQRAIAHRSVTSIFVASMARWTGNILLPALRAHCVRPKPLQAVLSLRFTYGNKHPAHEPSQAFSHYYCVARAEAREFVGFADDVRGEISFLDLVTEFQEVRFCVNGQQP